MRTISTAWIRAALRMLLLAATLWSGGSAIAQEALTGKRATAAHDRFHVINLSPHLVWDAQVNARSQVAFEYSGFDDRAHVAFYDGQRVIHPVPPENTHSSLAALNDHGDIAFEMRYLDPVPPATNNYQPRRWSLARGLSILPTYDPDLDTRVRWMNARGDIIGYAGTSPEPGSDRALRWSPANRMIAMPNPTGFTDSHPGAINDDNVGVGAAYDASGAFHAVLWDSATRPFVLGTFGGTTASAHMINNRTDVVGVTNADSQFSTFIWSPRKAPVLIGPAAAPRWLNDSGELVGFLAATGTATRAFLYSRARGMVDLHPPGLYASEAVHINASGSIGGSVRRTSTEFGRAYRWSRAQGAVDLNTRMIDAPRTLVLTNAAFISSNGDIAANSNAGLVLLRRGGGSDAPLLGPIELSDQRTNVPIQLTLVFRDRNLRNTHTATIDWGDGSGVQAAVLQPTRGGGEVRGTHTYTIRNSYDIVVRVTDSSGNTTEQANRFTFNLSGLATLAGAGILPANPASLAGAMDATPMAFRLSAPLSTADAAPFTFKLIGRTPFDGQRLETATVEGDKIRLTGTGQLDGRPGYRFALEATQDAGSGTTASRLAVTITAPDTLATAAARPAPPRQRLAYTVDGVVRDGALRITR